MPTYFPTTLYVTPHVEFEMSYFWNIVDCVTGSTNYGALLDGEFVTFICIVNDIVIHQP